MKIIRKKLKRIIRTSKPSRPEVGLLLNKDLTEKNKNLTETNKNLTENKKKKSHKNKKYKLIKDDIILTSKSSYLKFLYIVILTISFLVGNSIIIKPTIQKAELIEGDYNQKTQFIDNAGNLKASINKKIEDIKKENDDLQKMFFNKKKEQEDKFYKIFSESALNNKLQIVSLNKLSEDFYKEPKKDNPKEFVVSNEYSQVQYNVIINGNYLDYAKFIEDLKRTNKSLITNNVIISKLGDGIIKVTTTLTVNYSNI